MTTSVSVLFFDGLAICCFFGPTKSEISVLPTKVTYYFWNKGFSSDMSNNILLNIERTGTSFFEHRTNSNELEHVRLLVIELEHLIFDFERTNIEHQT